MALSWLSPIAPTAGLSTLTVTKSSMLSATTSTLNDFYQDKEPTEHSPKLDIVREDAFWFPEFDFTFPMGGSLNFINLDSLPVQSLGFQILPPTAAIDDRIRATPELQLSRRPLPRYQAILDTII